MATDTAPSSSLGTVLSTSTSSSFVPTPTHNNGSDASSNNNDTTDKLFSPGSSPPLILAFLAIGLFTLSMIAVFGWRRIQIARGIVPDVAFRDHGAGRFHPGGPHQHHHGRRSREVVGDPPKLHDLWTVRTGHDESYDALNAMKMEKQMPYSSCEKLGNPECWKDIMPITATVMREDVAGPAPRLAPRAPQTLTTNNSPLDQPRPGNTPLTPAPATATASLSTSPLPFELFRHYAWWPRSRNRRVPPSAADVGQYSESDTAVKTFLDRASAADDVPDASRARLQVAVAIAMPSFPHRRYIPHGDSRLPGASENMDDRVHYTIGLYDTDWNWEKG